jgi:aminocarboxymuconate-semialdehyde decarboxylase
MWEDNVLQWLFGEDEKSKQNLIDKILVDEKSLK